MCINGHAADRRDFSYHHRHRARFSAFTALLTQAIWMWAILQPWYFRRPGVDLRRGLLGLDSERMS